LGKYQGGVGRGGDRVWPGMVFTSRGKLKGVSSSTENRGDFESPEGKGTIGKKKKCQLPRNGGRCGGEKYGLKAPRGGGSKSVRTRFGGGTIFRKT